MTTARPTLTHDGARTAALAAERDRLVLTIPEAAETLGISRAFAYELCARGELPVIRLGRRRLVPKKALLAVLGEETPSAASDPRPAPLYRLVPEPALDR